MASVFSVDDVVGTARATLNFCICGNETDSPHRFATTENVEKCLEILDDPEICTLSSIICSHLPNVTDASRALFRLEILIHNSLNSIELVQLDGLNLRGTEIATRIALIFIEAYSEKKKSDPVELSFVNCNLDDDEKAILRLYSHAMLLIRT